MVLASLKLDKSAGLGGEHLLYLPSAPHVLSAAAASAGLPLVQFQALKPFNINTHWELPHYGW